MVTSKGASKLTSGVTATTTFVLTELEQFKETLNLDGMNEDINSLKSNVQKNNVGISGIKADINSLQSNVQKIGINDH